ncbi:hypothetical protein DY000_02031148 [Brassica cretica]|uniref:Uncharacterized protein n=1 Tax=Brassica cretica TaxID=69181 RepID=A0ABQ7DPH1_BRACR|nr:hypothetical protein DY000_02031148 [Brassica cretica]
MSSLSSLDELSPYSKQDLSSIELFQDEYHVNAIIEDDFWQVVKEEKLQEGDFDVKISKSFGNSHWCRLTPRDEHLSMEWDEHRSRPDVQHRSTESVASRTQLDTLIHPNPLQVDIDRWSEKVTDRQRDSTNDRQSTSVIDR